MIERASSKRSSINSARTRSADFPTTRPFQAALAGETDVFVAKFESDGDLVYSTYIGGSGAEQYPAIALDRLGDIHLAGVTSSPDLPTVNAVQSELRGSSDLFAMKVHSEGARLIYSTYLGGRSHEDGAGYPSTVHPEAEYHAIVCAKHQVILSRSVLLLDRSKVTRLHVRNSTIQFRHITG